MAKRFSHLEGRYFRVQLTLVLLPRIFLKGAQIYASARYMLLSGEHPMQSWTMLPGPRGWFPP